MEQLIGKSINCNGVKATIKEVYYAFHDAQDGWLIEFRDTNGKLRYWKQAQDGGTLS